MIKDFVDEVLSFPNSPNPNYNDTDFALNFGNFDPSYGPSTPESHKSAFMVDFDVNRQIPKNHTPPKYDLHDQFNNTPNMSNFIPIKSMNQRPAAQDQAQMAYMNSIYAPQIANSQQMSEKMNARSKQIRKRKGAAQQPQPEQNYATITKNMENNLSEVAYSELLEKTEAEKKRMEKVLKNRQSAQESRDKKKVYVKELEESHLNLKIENVSLTKQNAELSEKINHLAGLLNSRPCKSCGFVDNTADYGSVHNHNNSNQGGTSAFGKTFVAFSFAFTAFVCIVALMGDSSISSTSSAVLSQLHSLESMRSLDYIDELEPLQFSGPASNSKIAPASKRGYGYSTGQIPYEGYPILKDIKSLMDRFNDYHKELYSYYEIREDILDLSNHELFVNKTANSTNSTNSFSNLLPKSQNVTSTIFTPSGFEFFEASATAELNDESDTFFLSNTQSITIGDPITGSNLEKADFVQLLLPKNAINRYSVTANSTEIVNTQAYRDVEDHDVLIEVWCRVFAIRDLVNNQI